MLDKIVDLTEQAAALVDRVAIGLGRTRGLRSGDRVYTPLVVYAEFSQGQAASRNVVFNIPADADFWAYRLLLIPQCKVIDPVNGTPSDLAFRSTSFVGQPYSPGVVDPEQDFSDFNNTVDGSFGFMYEGKELQNNDLPFAAAYGQQLGKWGVDENSPTATGWCGSVATPSGLVFDIPFFLARGKSLTLRLTPSYLGVRTIEETIYRDEVPTTIVRQNLYRIVAILEGEKRVNAFR
jgi:hypothetical protein